VPRRNSLHKSRAAIYDTTCVIRSTGGQHGPQEHRNVAEAAFEGKNTRFKSRKTYEENGRLAETKSLNLGMGLGHQR